MLTAAEVDIDKESLFALQSGSAIEEGIGQTRLGSPVPNFMQKRALLGSAGTDKPGECCGKPSALLQ
jgi:hypothetical protein